MSIFKIIFAELSSLFFYFYHHGNNNRVDEFNAVIKLRMEGFYYPALQKSPYSSPV